jgi:hypothetical protein
MSIPMQAAAVVSMSGSALTPSLPYQVPGGMWRPNRKSPMAWLSSTVSS